MTKISPKKNQNNLYTTKITRKNNCFLLVAVSNPSNYIFFTSEARWTALVAGLTAAETSEKERERERERKQGAAEDGRSRTRPPLA